MGESARRSHVQTTTSTAGCAVQRAPGKRTLVEARYPVQRRAERPPAPASDEVHAHAEAGVAGAATPLPHLDRIQASFGRHDVSGIGAHVGGPASEAAEAIGAEAYATGTQVAFRAAPDLHTAAHEAAHVVQQRAGVALKGGVGEDGDPYERHADAVADAVVAGRSSEALLDQMTGGGHGGSAPVQRKTVTVSGGEFDDGGKDMYAPYLESTQIKGDDAIERGAVMKRLSFRPNKDLTNASGEAATEVSLVQTTNSTVIDVQNPHAEDQPESMMEDRRTESGTAIDQQIYLTKDPQKGENITWSSDELLQAFLAMAGKGTKDETNELITTYVKFFRDGKGANSAIVPKFGVTPGVIKKKLQGILDSEGGGVAEEIAKGIPLVVRILDAQNKLLNLDPRYPERRDNDKDPLKQTQPQGRTPNQTTGWPARRSDGNGDWEGNAVLRDRPAHTVLADHQLRGREVFEVSAMVNGSKLAGSIRWGWKIDGQDPELDPAEIEKVDDGSASVEFFKAAKAWNSMKVKDLVDLDKTHSPFQIPTHQMPTEKESEETTEQKSEDKTEQKTEQKSEEKKLPELTWTDGKLDGDKRNVGGSFEEYRGILDALRRYQSVKDSGKLELVTKMVLLVKERCLAQLEGRPNEARNEVVKEVLSDAERVLSSL